jgi:hypothetical protein
LPDLKTVLPNADFVIEGYVDSRGPLSPKAGLGSELSSSNEITTVVKLIFTAVRSHHNVLHRAGFQTGSERFPSVCAAREEWTGVNVLSFTRS